jgi:WYL_2, Sm-like SH3 beta-barrel fold
MEKHVLTDHLKSGIVTVVFEKVDGTERIMRATLAPEHLPEVVGGTSDRILDDDLIPVWDIEKSGWRSFRLSKVKRIIVG